MPYPCPSPLRTADQRFPKHAFYSLLLFRASLSRTNVGDSSFCRLFVCNLTGSLLHFVGNLLRFLLQLLDYLRSVRSCLGSIRLDL